MRTQYHRVHIPLQVLDDFRLTLTPVLYTCQHISHRLCLARTQHSAREDIYRNHGYVRVPPGLHSEAVAPIVARLCELMWLTNYTAPKKNQKMSIGAFLQDDSKILHAPTSTMANILNRLWSHVLG